MRSLSMARVPHTIILICSCILGSTATGQPPSPMSILDSAIGAPVKLFQEQQRTQIEAEYRQTLAVTSDPLQRDALKRERNNRSRQLEGTYTEFSGNSDYDESLLSGEFLHGEGDAMMKARNGEDETFYFFNQGRLWKVLLSMPANIDIEGIERHLDARFGEAARLKGSNGEDELIWESNGRIIELSDRRADYGCFTLTHADAGLYEIRRNKTITKATPKLNPMIQAVLSGGGDDSVSDVVDHILDQPSAGTR